MNYYYYYCCRSSAVQFAVMLLRTLKSADLRSILALSWGTTSTTAAAVSIYYMYSISSRYPSISSSCIHLLVVVY